MSKAHKLAWAAGFFDGEGYVYIQRVFVNSKTIANKQYTNHRLRIGINHVAPHPLQEMANLLGGKVLLDKSSLKQAKDGHKRKPRYMWYLHDDAAKQALINLMPYLQNKNSVAELAIEFRNTFTALGGGVVSEEILQKRQWYKDEITRLNSLD